MEAVLATHIVVAAHYPLKDYSLQLCNIVIMLGNYLRQALKTINYLLDFPYIIPRALWTIQLFI